jgi:hypothetical protein
LQSYLDSSGSNLEPFVQPFGLEIGLPKGEIYIRLNEDPALAKIIEAGGADVETVRAAMIDALSEIPDARELDVDQLASDWLDQ